MKLLALNQLRFFEAEILRFMCNAPNSNYHWCDSNRRDDQASFADWIVARLIMDDNGCADDPNDTKQTYEKPTKKPGLPVLE